MQLIALILAAWRLTDIITVEQVFDPIRRKWPLYIWSCSRCVSVWAAVVAYLAYRYFPAVNIVLAVSELFILRVMLESVLLRRGTPGADPNMKGQILIEVDQRNNINLKRCDFRADAAMTVLSQVAQAMAAKNGG